MNIHHEQLSQAGGELPEVPSWSLPGGSIPDPDATLVDPAGWELHPYYAVIDAARTAHLKRNGSSVIKWESEELVLRTWPASGDPRRHRIAPHRYDLYDWSMALEELRRVAAERGIKVQEPPLGYTLSTARDAAKENGNEWYFSVQDFDMAVLTGTLVITTGFIQEHNRQPGSEDTTQTLSIELQWQDKDPERTRRRLEAALGKGDTSAALSLGMMYAEGEEAADLERAVQYLEMAHKAGVAQASYNLGIMHQQGLGVVEDIERARQYWEAACAAEGEFVAEAASNLACIYRFGDGVAVDLERAIQLFEKALEAGDVQAANNLGSIYMEGAGVEQNPRLALQYFEMAHDAGDSEASFNIGMMYETGEGVPVDLERARQYYMAASAAGDDDATAKLQELACSDTACTEEEDENVVEGLV